MNICANTFTNNWKLPFSNEEEELLYKYFHDKSPQKLCGQAGIWTSEPWSRGYKTFFMLNSAEHEIYIGSANKSQITNIWKILSCLT